MSRFGKIALGALLVGGLATGATLPASAARIGIGIGLGVPAYGYYGGYYGHSCRWYAVRGLAAPAGCYGGYYGYGYGPVVYGGYYGRPWHRAWVGGRWHWRRW